MRKEELNQLPDCAREFITYLNIIKGKSDLTVLEYASDLRTFFRYLKVLRGLASPDDDFEKIDISDIDIPFIEKISLMDAYNYLVYCKDVRKNSDRTRARKVSTLRQFFDYLYKKTKKIKENPMSELEMPKFKKSMPKYLTYDQCVALLNSVEGKNKQRDYCILTLFLNCGLRLAELCSLNYSDIRDDGTMIVTGKGDKERVVYLNNACIYAIKDYLQVRPVDSIKDRRALFISAQGKRLSRESVQKMVQKYLEKAGLADEFQIDSAAACRDEIGNPVYPPARRKLAKHGISCEGHAARQLTAQDYEEYDLLISMEGANLKNMQRICGGDPAGKMHRLLDYTDRPGDVADPWYTGDFEATWRDVSEGCKCLLAEIEKSGI